MTSHRTSASSASWRRRDFLRQAAALGFGVAAFGVTPRSARSDGQVSYYTWSGYEAPELHQKYTAKHGGMPDVTIFASEAEALTKVNGGFKVDFVHPCVYDIGRWRAAGLIQPFDTGKIPAWETVFPELTNIANTPGETQPWMMPFDWGNGSVLYRTDLVDIQEPSWSLLFDKRYAGKLSMWGAIDGAVDVAGIVAGAKNIFDMTDDELAKVKQLLIEQRDLMRFYWDDPTTIEQALASGELVAAYAWNQSFLNLKKQGVPVAYMRPKEGIITWVCGLVMLKDAPSNEADRYDFVNSMLDPETGRFLIESYGYGHSNTKSFELVSPERLAELGLPSSPTEMFKGSIVLKLMDVGVREKYTRMFEEIKAGG